MRQNHFKVLQFAFQLVVMDATTPLRTSQVQTSALLSPHRNRRFSKNG
jgi:hypothetical protein